ncbi:tRNA(adenine(34)) deaminase, chloroplastic isoform X1 [Morus notabilis]|nr:tRNA(adenine(34)) deaminase, chloroplastic isoform X1 [Morus notabilis]
MHDTYISSTIYALRSKGSLSFSFNDYSYLLHERFDRNPFQTSFSRCCCCCCCCGFSTQKVPINPCYLYGPRQSTLLQWSASRKLILGGGDRCYYHCSPISGIDRDFYDFSWSLKERSFCNTSRRRSKGRCCCVVDKGDGGMYDSRRLNDAEALLSLLSEEVDEDYVFGGKRRNWSSYKRVEVKGKGGFSSSSRERSLGLSDRAQAKKRVNNDGICNCGKKKVDGLRSEEGNTKRGYESIRIESRGEELRRNRDRGAISRGENRRLRKDNSSCSSYYSLSSSGDFDDETEVHDKHTLLAEESLSGYEDSELKGAGKFDGQTTEKYEGYVDDIHEQGEVSDQRKITIVDDVEWDQRKKTEKKYNDRLGQEIQHGRESSQRQSQVSGFRRSSYEKTSSSHKQFNDEEDTSTSAVSLDKRTRKQYAQNENRVVEASTSRRKLAEKKEIQEFHRDDIQRTSQSHIRVGSTGEKDEQRKEVSYVAEEQNSKRNNQQVRRFSEAQDFDTRRTTISQNQSEIGVIGVEGYRENVSSSLQGREQSQHKTSQEAVQQADMRRKSQQATTISKIYDTNIDRTSVMQSETNNLNQVQNTNLISISYPGSMEPNSQTAGQRPPQRIQSGRGSHDVNDMTVVHSSENERVTDSRRDYERRVHQESEATSVVKLVGETREEFTQRQIRCKKELEEVSTSQEPLILDSEARMLKDDADERVQRSSQTILMPPPSQFLSKSSLHVELASGVENQKVSSSTFESGSSSSYPYPRIQPPALQQESYERNESAEAYREPLYLITSEDALASADRLQQSSAQFVGEFVEKVRHEVSTSEIQKVAEVSEITLASEADKDGQNKLTQYASKDFQPKEHDKGHSSGGSGTKGPSDEMWDVSDPSSFRTPREEKTEPTTTMENAIIKRSGRSLWNIIADIVTLRWGSRPETPSSTGRSGRRVSQNESVPSESWFSAHESEQSKDKHAQDKGLPLETMSDQLLVTTLSTPGQGTESVVLELTEHRRDLEPEPSSSTSMMQSRSTSKGISSSGDENLGWNDDGRSLGGSPSGMEIVELSSQPTARSENSTILSQISDTGNTKSGLLGQIEQYNPAKSTEVLGAAGNSGELKRRKLQRNKQVPKDRFEVWEEAYKLESEQRKIDEMFMREALLEAKKAADTWEVPVGAVLVQHGKIIARGYNLVEELRDSTAHAEMICIREASNQLRTWRLADTTLYVTLEPCPMCAGAILQARITTLVWGAPNKLLGADGSWIRLFPDGEGGNNSEVSEKPAAPVHPFHPKMNIRRGILASDCAEVMQQFFQLRRKKKEKHTEEAPSSPLSSSHPSKLLKKMHDVFHLMFCL